MYDVLTTDRVRSLCMSSYLVLGYSVEEAAKAFDLWYTEQMSKAWAEGYQAHPIPTTHHE
jgi:transposase